MTETYILSFLTGTQHKIDRDNLVHQDTTGRGSFDKLPLKHYKK